MWYDCTEFASKHPGGEILLRLLDGKDATDHFHAAHSTGVALQVLKNLPTLTKKPRKKNTSRLERAYADIQQEAREQGLYEANPSPYLSRALCLFLILLLSIISTNVILSACLFALFLQQCAFIGHDAGHNSIFKKNRHNNMLGIFVGNLCTGISIGWWKSTHNTHHAATNSLDWDPDIQHAPLLVVDKKYLRDDGIYSEFHKRTMTVTPFWRKVIQYQHIYFYPLMMVARFNLYFQSFYFVLKKQDNIMELVALCCYNAGLIYMASSKGSMYNGILWLLLSHALAGILHVQIALSHFFMQSYDGAIHKDTPERECFLRTQIATTTDLHVPEWSSWFHGGLHLQTTHHIFPRIPRDKLLKARSLVLKLCEKNNIQYNSMGWYEANRALVSALKENGLRGNSSIVSGGLSAAG